MFQWITIATAITAIAMVGIAIKDVSKFNDRCAANGIELQQCWNTQLEYVWGM